MSLGASLRRLKPGSRHPQSKARRKLSPRGPFVPRLHLLEDRTLPSTFMVRNLLDSGVGSLRQAVLDANANGGADLIAFAPELLGTIGLTSGQLSSTDPVTIDGPGAGRLTVSGNDASRIFAIGSGVTVTIDDLTITRRRPRSDRRQQRGWWPFELRHAGRPRLGHHQFLYFCR